MLALHPSTFAWAPAQLPSEAVFLRFPTPFWVVPLLSISVWFPVVPVSRGFWRRVSGRGVFASLKFEVIFPAPTIALVEAFVLLFGLFLRVSFTLWGQLLVLFPEPTPSFLTAQALSSVQPQVVTLLVHLKMAGCALERDLQGSRCPCLLGTFLTVAVEGHL